MKVEIWSDIMCPFCYIGKRNFETALGQFAGKNHIEIIWKSFQLDPTLPEVADQSQEDYLVKRKGMSIEKVTELLANVTQTAKQTGLEYNFDKIVMVNSLNAHKLMQFSKTKGLGNQSKERLFKAFFTEGKNIADIATLIQLGMEIGLAEGKLKAAFTNDNYAYMVRQDIEEAQSLGVRGVPFFVFDRKYAVSGAQPPQAFLETLDKSFTEWRKKHPEINLDISHGQSCNTDGICE